MSNVGPLPGTRRSLHSALHMVGAMRGLWSSDLNRAAIDLLNPQPSTTVLDLGAGLGPATIDAARRIRPGGRVIAVDPSPTMRGALRVRRSWQSTRRLIEIRKGSAEQLPITTASVDAAWAINAAHHFDNLDHAVTELARVLKPGGRLLLVDEDFADPKHPYHHLDTGDTDPPEPVDTNQVAELLTEVGLTVTRAENNQAIADVTATIITATKPSSFEATR